MMENRLAQLEARIQALEDTAAIERLKHRYLRACDRKQPEEVRDCLSPRGAIIAYEGFPHFADRDSFVDVFREMACRPHIIDLHYGQNAVITLTGADRAVGTWDLLFHSIDTVAGTLLQMGCEYSDEYVRADGRWWIARTATRRTSFLLQTIGAGGVPTVSVLGTPPNVPYGT